MKLHHMKYGKVLEITLCLHYIGATLVVFIATKTDIAVLLGYLFYYFFMGRILNRPKYVTDLGKLIVFPIPSALGAFTGYKLSYFLIQTIIIMEQPIFMYNPCFRDHRGTFAPQPLIFGESKREELRKKWIQSNVSFNDKKIHIQRYALPRR